MIARDEECDLPRCLASLDCDDLVVVDTGSRDRTVTIARAAGAHVIELAWPHDFAAARNVALDAATGDWILVIDADEELPAETRAQLRAEVAQADALGLSGVSLIQRNLSPPGEVTTYQDLPIVRLFRRAPHVRYEGRIHEQVSPSIVRAGGALGASDLWFLHHGYARTQAQGSGRAQRNLALLVEAVRDAPDDAYLHYQLGATQKALGDPAAAASLERALAGRAALSPSAEADARMKLAQLAAARGDDPAALAEARRCLALDPHNVIALQLAIVTAIGLQHVVEAAGACRALLACRNVAAATRADAEHLLHALTARPA
ncbi:MAG: glycosyltransferase [Kofleriaceae bacterium]